MRKDFNQLNYYEMLDLQPNAVPYEIRHAYNAAMQLYQPGSLVSYSFFSEKERRDSGSYRKSIPDPDQRPVKKGIR